MRETISITTSKPIDTSGALYLDTTDDDKNNGITLGKDDYTVRENHDGTKTIDIRMPNTIILGKDGYLKIGGTEIDAKDYTRSVDTNPAPNIDAAMAFFGENQELDLARIEAMIIDGKMKFAKTGILMTDKERKDKNKVMIDNLNKAAENQRLANQNTESANFWGLLVRSLTVVVTVVAAIGAVVAAATTGGAAIPLAVLACAAAVGAIVSLASTVSVKNGGEPFDFSVLATKLGMLIVTARFGPEWVAQNPEKAEAEAKVWGGAMMIVITIGTVLAADPAVLGEFVGGWAEIAGHSDETAQWMSFGFTILGAILVGGGMFGFAKAAAKTSATFAQKGSAFIVDLAKWVSIGGGAANGSGQVVQGRYMIAAGVDRYNADMALAGNKALDADLMELDAMLKELCDDLVHFMEVGTSTMEAIAEWIHDTGETMKKLATYRNEGGQSI